VRAGIATDRTPHLPAARSLPCPAPAREARASSYCSVAHAGLIVSSALMLWKTLILITGSESPVRTPARARLGGDDICRHGNRACAFQRGETVQTAAAAFFCDHRSIFSVQQRSTAIPKPLRISRWAVQHAAWADWKICWACTSAALQLPRLLTAVSAVVCRLSRGKRGSHCGRKQPPPTAHSL